jgi:hypothetical protein
MRGEYGGTDDLEDEEEETSLKDILKSLLNADSDLELKTQVLVPKDVAGLQVIASILRMYKLNGSAQLLETFIEYYLKLMVSYQRRGRKEIIDAVSGLMERERQLKFSQRLTSDVAK